MSFRYEPLHPERTEFRLLRLEPAPTLEQRVVSSLHVNSLTNQPSFEALSYHWGDASITRTIELDGVEWPVTINLESALRHIRHASEPRIIWVDAVCINQQDNIERNHQVAMMRSIYSSATTVLVWLGEAADDSDRMMAHINNIRPMPRSPFLREAMKFGDFTGGGIYHGQTAERRTRQRNDFAGELASIRGILDSGALGSLSSTLTEQFSVLSNLLKTVPERTERELPPVDALFARPWWSRIWVVQEVLLAKQTMWYCGSSNASFTKLFEFVDNATGHDLTVRRAFQPHSTYTTVVMPFLELRKISSPLHLLSYAWSRHATDLRDKIYGLLGLLSDDRYRTAPRYDWTVEQVYTAYAIQLLCLCQDLDILDFVSGKRNLALELPSWVPDWSITNYDSYHYVQHELSQGHKACGNLERLLDVVEDGKIRVRGVPIDTVASTGHVFVTNMQSSEKPSAESPEVQQLRTYTQWMDLCGERYSDFQSSYVSGGTIQTSFWWTVTRLFNIDNHHSKPIQCRPDDVNMQNLFDQWLVWLQDPEIEPSMQITKLQNTITTCNQGLRFIITREGYFGTAPKQTLPGDVVYVLGGGKQAYVLRPTHEVAGLPAFDVVGCCYIYGVMNGEVTATTEREPEKLSTGTRFAPSHDIVLV